MQPFADVTAFWAGSVALPGGQEVNFKKYRRPPALSRGICSACNSPVVGYMSLAPFAKLAFVPSQNVPLPAALPQPRAHIFYHRRQQDAHDTLPKFSGYWPSEFMVTGLVLAGTFSDS